MNELIKIDYREIGCATVHTCNARDLHSFLGVQTAFKDWISRRIYEYGFSDDKGFCSFLSETKGGRKAKDVAEILEYSDAGALTRKLDDDEIQNRQIGGFGPGVRQTADFAVWVQIPAAEELPSVKKAVLNEPVNSV